MIPIPPFLSPILDHLYGNHITPIIVGGYVRDALMRNTQSKDMDIELYAHHPLESIESLLSPFGKVNLVGKSFGVLKLRLEEWEIDFSLPRTESKEGRGHKGFLVHTDSTLDFATAAKRRDFTINAIGFDPQTATLLDPYHGRDDIHHRRLAYVDATTFGEDPLRVLRAIQFAGRFNLTCDEALLELCQQMILQGALDELPHERIFEEFKKLLLLSPRPSVGLALFARMGGRVFLSLEKDDAVWETTLARLDATGCDLALRLAALLLDTSAPKAILERLTAQRSLLAQTLAIINHTHTYGVMTIPPKPLLQGRDLIHLGLLPSVEFTTVLDKAYDAQCRNLFETHEEAVHWLRHECNF